MVPDIQYILRTPGWQQRMGLCISTINARRVGGGTQTGPPAKVGYTSRRLDVETYQHIIFFRGLIKLANHLLPVQLPADVGPDVMLSHRTAETGASADGGDGMVFMVAEHLRKQGFRWVPVV